MGDLEDGWNDLKRLLIEKKEKKRGSLAGHGLRNDSEKERKTERGRDGRGEEVDSECKKVFHIEV